MRLPPLPQPNDDMKKAAPSLGQPIFLIGTSVRRRDEFQHADIHQVMQTTRQDALGHTQALLKLPETPHAVEGVADNEKRPPVADRIQRPRHRTICCLQTGTFDQGLLHLTTDPQPVPT